jgi:hypothetical protein
LGAKRQKHEWHSFRCAIRLLGMEKKKKEKDGEAIKEKWFCPSDGINLSDEHKINLKFLKFEWMIT